MIPKIFHRIWLGKNPIPDDHERFWRTWKNLHREFIFITWDDDRVKHFNLLNKETFEKCKSFSEQSDVVRYELLLRIGGNYIDTDFECISSIEPLIKNLSCYACTLESKTIATGILGSVAGHPLYELLVQNLKDNYKDVKDCWSLGPVYFTNVVEFYLRNTLLNNLTIFERQLFYPYHYSEKKPDTYNSLAVHHWATSYRTEAGLVPK